MRLAILGKLNTYRTEEGEGGRRQEVRRCCGLNTKIQSRRSGGQQVQVKNKNDELGNCSRRQGPGREKFDTWGGGGKKKKKTKKGAS